MLTSSPSDLTTDGCEPAVARPTASDDVTHSVLDPVEGILAVLNEGSTTGSNKFGLLLALIDLAPEVAARRQNVLSISEIAEKLIELHWNHARPYRDSVLRQVTSGNRRNTTTLLVIERLRSELQLDLPFEGAHHALVHDHPEKWRRALSEVATATAKNPLRLLQVLPGNPPPFLYRIAGDNSITFVDGALDALVRYGPVLRELVEFRFVRLVIKANRLAVGVSVEEQVAEHLFGKSRHMPPRDVRHELWILQGRHCLYSGRAVPDPASSRRQAALDHVVPWSRAHLSALENFVVTDGATNSAKRDLLLAPVLIERWAEYLAAKATALSGLADAYGWPTDLARVAGVAAVLYRGAPPSAPVWAPTTGVTTLDDAGRATVAAALSTLTETRLPTRHA